MAKLSSFVGLVGGLGLVGLALLCGPPAWGTPTEKPLLRCADGTLATGVVIGFEGMGGAFDSTAFTDYARMRQLCPVQLAQPDTPHALQLVTFSHEQGTRYELYGFSKGAESVRDLLAKVRRQGQPMPAFVLTIAAWHTPDLDFRHYGVPFLNVFDDSGRGQRAPGVMLAQVRHDQMQRRVLQNWAALQAWAVGPKAAR